MNIDKAVVVYSGGLDSYTTLHAAIRKHGKENVIALSVDYGQRHKRELQAASQVCLELGIPQILHNASNLRELLGNSALTAGGEVPEGHYADESMKQTVVPNRNMIFLSLAVGVAVNQGAAFVYTGVHAGDHAIYPDCRPEFIAAMNQVTRISNYQPVEIVTPFLHANKADIVAYGLRIGLDYSKTWTCYNGRELPCGKCGSCVERLEAFHINNTHDPLCYEGKV